MATYLGIDLGTSALKALLVDEAGVALAQESAALTVERPRPGWSEQSPDAWVAACMTALDALAARAPEAMAAVRGVGLSGQMHGATLLGADDRPLRPCMLWNDGRAEAQCAELEAAADFRGVAGNAVMAGFTAPKVAWVRAHEPEVFARTARVLLPKDYLRLALTGETVSDPSDAAGTLWLDVDGRTWSPALLAACGLDETATPRLVEGCAASGRLREGLAARWGMASAPVVAGGAGDNAASACGVGAVRPGEGFVSLGTSGVLFLATAGFAPNPGGGVHAFCHAGPGLWHQMGVILSAADSLSWLARALGRPPEAVAAMAAQADPATTPLFLPYLSGERTPHADAGLRGAFVGLDHAAGPEALARATMEGVAFAFADCAEALAGAGGARPSGPLHAVGGGSRSDLWLRMIVDATGLALARPAGAEAGAALGAARLGLCAASGEALSSVCSPAPAADVIEPGPGAGLAAERLARWREALPASRF